jgi:hypothetical protein
MKKKGIAILVILALIGMVIALAFVKSMGETSIFTGRVSHGETLPYWQLTGEERETAIEIAMENETVRQYLGLGYNISGHSPDCIYRNDETGVAVGRVLLTKAGLGGSWYLHRQVFVYVNLNTGEVAGIDEGLEDFRLTEEQEKKAKQIALSDPEVKRILKGKDYEIVVGRPLVKMSSYEIPVAEGFSVMGSTEELIGASVKIVFTDGTVVLVDVSQEKGEVIRISQ